MKVILKFLNKGSSNQESVDIEYKTLMDIHKEYPQYSYHMLRQVYLQSMGKDIKKMHPNTLKLYNVIRIVDDESPVMISPVANQQPVIAA